MNGLKSVAKQEQYLTAKGIEIKNNSFVLGSDTYELIELRSGNKWRVFLNDVAGVGVYSSPTEAAYYVAWINRYKN